MLALLINVLEYKPLMPPIGFKKRIGRFLTPILRVIFRMLQAFGFHLVRNHYYGPVPDTRYLHDEIWEKGSELIGIKMNPQKQLEIADQVFPLYSDECQFTSRESAGLNGFCFGNNSFESFDAEVLYSFVRYFKPNRVMEIGAGYSTLISLQSSEVNKMKDGIITTVVSVDPFPNLRILGGIHSDRWKLIEQPVEKLPLEIFTSLTPNDILFIDPSHVLKIGSDVKYEYLEILPRLPSGVLIHLHDIFLPFEYPQEWVLDQHVFWNEQYLLQAFLSFNDAFEVLWASSFMSINHKETLELAFPKWKGSFSRFSHDLISTPTRDGQNVWPCSFWLRKK